jgi:hypothetical protein
MCGVRARLRLHDIVIVSKESARSGRSPAEPLRTWIFHRGCESDRNREDHDWTRELPQTLCRVHVAVEGDTA